MLRPAYGGQGPPVNASADVWSAVLAGAPVRGRPKCQLGPRSGTRWAGRWLRPKPRQGSRCDRRQRRRGCRWHCWSRRGVTRGARGPTCSAQGLAPYVYDHGQDEKHRTEGNNRARPEPWLRLCELVHNRGAKCGARSHERMRPRRFVADHKRDGDRLAQSPSDGERHGGGYTGASCRPHDFVDDLPARGTKCHGGFPVGHRDMARAKRRARKATPTWAAS